MFFLQNFAQTSIFLHSKFPKFRFRYQKWRRQKTCRYRPHPFGRRRRQRNATNGRRKIWRTKLNFRVKNQWNFVRNHENFINFDDFIIFAKFRQPFRSPHPSLERRRSPRPRARRRAKVEELQKISKSRPDSICLANFH